jgi:hypothetical protein
MPPTAIRSFSTPALFLRQGHSALCRFFVTFASNDFTRLTQSTRKMEQSEKATLLIIEDHEIVALGLKTLIGSNPALSTVDCATNARQAIQLTVNHPYNLYIIDVELHDMTDLPIDGPAIVIHHFFERPSLLSGVFQA